MTVHATCSKEIMEMWNWVFDESVGKQLYMSIGIHRKNSEISHETYDHDDNMLPGSAALARHGPHVFHVYVDHFVDAVFMSLKWGQKLS